MFVFLIALLVCIALAVGVAAVVLVGMKGLYRERNPKVAGRLSQIASTMNGEGEPPEAFERLLAAARR